MHDLAAKDSRHRQRHRVPLGKMEWVKDFWRCGIVHADASSILARGSLDDFAISWLPGTRGLTYLADPFALWRDDQLHVFVENFDYVSGRGRIDAITFSHKFQILSQKTVISERWHLSYPYVFEADGDIWMLPEAHQSGTSWLYRSAAFPDRWVRSYEIALPHVPLDATIVRRNDRWWLFYAAAHPIGERLTALYAAHAPCLAGPWTACGDGPILRDPAGARPGGTPIVQDDVMYLPLQSCVKTYGSGVRVAQIDTLTPERISARIITELSAPRSAAPFNDGCHTLAAAGAVTLIDVKQRRFSPLALATWPLRRA
ncbi:formyl transferase [Sphingomonas sp. NBWT7]|uniref:glucosamine inositolphosphorylceramide transferase family protein n=1 Tax=Sphingomonas sp. NBWT7 TaxID=2596913 RepID=UPI00162AC61B|nr:formyl transferase [Sphingomonas sp. NBWT7]QNE31043.1 formyl transferase [Sphingomonas sp. NBWT7]